MFSVAPMVVLQDVNKKKLQKYLKSSKKKFVVFVRSRKNITSNVISLNLNKNKFRTKANCNHVLQYLLNQLFKISFLL